MRNTRKSALFVVCLCAVLASSPALAIYHGWSETAGNRQFDLPQNWGISQADAFSRAACRAGCESQIGYSKSGTYTLSSDIWVNRYVLDREKQEVVFDFGDHTATFIGLDNVAFGATASAKGESVFVKSGTIRIPASFLVDGVEKINQYSFLGLPRDNYGVALADATIMADGDRSTGVHGTIDVRATRLLYGTNNCIGARNGGVFKTKSLSFNANDANSASNHLTFATGGVWQNANETPSHLDIAFSGTAKGHRIEFLDGGTLSGFNGLYVNGGSFFRMLFSGADTAIAIEADSDVSKLNGIGNRLEVVNGAQVKLLNSNGSNRARIWIGTGTSNNDGNVIRVDGEGSLLELTAAGTLVGQHSGQGNGIEVVNHGELIVNSVHIGQGEWSANEQNNPETYKRADNNYVTVSSGGRLIDTSTTYVGFGGAPLRGGRLTVTSDGVVSNQEMSVGNCANALSNVVLVADGGKILTRGNVSIANGNPVSSGNRFTVGTNGTFVAGGNLTIGTAAASGLLETVSSGNVFEVLSNGVAKVAGFTDYGRDTLLRIDGGAIRATGMVVLPYYNPGNTNLTVEISGAAPVLRTDCAYDYSITKVGYAMSFRKWAHIKFKIPKNGWSEPPLQAPNGELGIFGNSVLEFDLDEFLAENGGVGGNVVLTDTRLANYETYMIDASNALLRERYGVWANGTARCRLVKDGQRLVLKTPSGKGLTLIFR